MATKTEKPKRRKSARYASVYYVDQIEKLDAIAAEKGVSRAYLLKEGADYIIFKHEDLQKGDA